MKATSLWVGLAAVCVLAPALAFAPAAHQNPPALAANDVHDFVFLSEARPVFIRLHVRVDGRPVQAGWDGFMKYLFAYLDVNGDGVLNKEEAERAPTVEQIISGIPNSGFGAFGGMGGGPTHPTMAELDADKDGKVTLAELAAYYKSHGFAPFQLQTEAKQPNPFGQFFGGSREPTVEAVSEAIFALLDTNKDGKLTKEELAAAPAVLLRLDENDDEMIVPQELAKPAPIGGGMGGMMGFKGPGTAEADSRLMLVESTRKTSKELVRQILARYGPSSDNPMTKKLSRKDLGLDEATFAKLDSNGDGVLDASELARFLDRPADVEMVIRLGAKAGEARVELAGKAGPLTGKVKWLPGLALLELGATRVELRGTDADRADRLGGLLRQQYVAQFKQADKDASGYLDEKEAKASGLFKDLFQAMDRKGNGKVYEKDLIAYLDQLVKLKNLGRAGCVTLVLTNQSRGLFDLLDVDRDGRLSVREMRGAVKLLDQLGAAGKGFLTRADMPKSYLLTLRRGGSLRGGFDFNAALEEIYGGYEATDVDYPTAGPLWFQKMDKNRDGDVSRKEFLGTDEQFRLIDTDGDGLISLEEALRYDALQRKKK
jgi:Ca2+-binding EF-hand superfamily protein